MPFLLFLAIVSFCKHVDTRWEKSICVYSIMFTQRHRMKSVSHLPDPNNSVGDEDKKNNQRLYKGGDRLLSFFKQSQHLDKHAANSCLVRQSYSAHCSLKTFSEVVCFKGGKKVVAGSGHQTGNDCSACRDS